MEPGTATAQNAKMVAIVLEVEAERLGSLLPAPLVPRRLYGTTCAMSIQFIDIPESTVGPYRECTVSVLCKENVAWPRAEDEGWRSLLGFPIWIAVTSDVACFYGREVWAYPKFVGDVHFELHGDEFRGFAAVAGGPSVRCSAALTRELDATPVEFRSVSRRGDQLLLAPMPGHARFAADWDPRADYELDLQALGMGVVRGTSATGMYAADLCFELLPPTALPLSEVGAHGKRASR